MFNAGKKFVFFALKIYRKFGSYIADLKLTLFFHYCEVALPHLIALVCGLKVQEGCQDGLCVKSDADETLAWWESR